MGPAIDIESIVREVVRRLAALPEASSANGHQAGNSIKQLNLPGRVISLARLDGKLNGIERLAVERGAVITPAVRDLLRTRNIALVFHETVTTASRGDRLVCGLAETNYEPATVWEALRSEGLQLESLARTGLTSVVAELADHVARGGALAVMLTEQPAAAICLANRHSGVRAAQAGCMRSLREIIEAVGVNLLVINPSGKSRFELQRVIGRYAAAGGHCPADLREHLR